MVPVEVGVTNQGMANLPEGAPTHFFCSGGVGVAVGRAASRMPL